MAFSGDGRMLLSCSMFDLRSNGLTPEWHHGGDESGAVKVWDVSNGVLLASLSETSANRDITPQTACFSSCGSYVVSVSDDKGALLWRTSDWSCVAEVSGGGAEVTRVAMSPDGRVLCCGTKAGTVFFHRIHDLVSPVRTDQDTVPLAVTPIHNALNSLITRLFSAIGWFISMILLALVRNINTYD